MSRLPDPARLETRIKELRLTASRWALNPEAQRKRECTGKLAPDRSRKGAYRAVWRNPER